MDTSEPSIRPDRHIGMSYKFQRLREKIREAVVCGELSGKLPGERELARRFHVNAKTLSKALTDLAAEGLLHRSIGRGTFVKGAEAAEVSSQGPWLLLVDALTDPTLVENLKALNPEAEISDDIPSLRPSYLSQFAAVVDLAHDIPESFLRDLLIRNIPVVAVAKQQRTYSTNAVLLDVMLGAAYLTRDLVLGGHRRFLAIERRNHTTIAEGIRRSAMRYGSDFCVDACSPADVVGAMEHGATACICDSTHSASMTLAELAEAGVSVPEQMSVAAVGGTHSDCPCTGYYADPRQKAAAVADILRQGQPGRPTTLWLSGTLIDRGTTAHRAGIAELESTGISQAGAAMA